MSGERESLSGSSSFRILFVFALTLSMLSSPLVPSFKSPISIPSARGALMNDQNWYPAGPSMDHIFFPIFADQATEFRSFPSQFDFADIPLSATNVASYQTTYPVTKPTSQGTTSSIDFNFANNFWGCSFNYAGSNDLSSCGVQIRMGIAHLIDRGAFAVDEPDIQGIAVDNAAGKGLTPDPCAWDPLFPETGTGCQV